jgi:hypothetical protein
MLIRQFIFLEGGEYSKKYSLRQLINQSDFTDEEIEMIVQLPINGEFQPKTSDNKHECWKVIRVK